MEDVIIVGAGPCGLAAALSLREIGIDPLVIEKESLVHSIYLYPTYMQFFSTADRLEIGGFPFTTPNEKPTRLEALHYYRNVAKRSNIRIRSYEKVTDIIPENGTFAVLTENRARKRSRYEAKRVVIATGYFDNPNMLGIPGETLPKVSHFFREAHPYTGTKTAIIGGSNSAVDAALELMRADAEVTIVYRGEAVSPNIKPWVRPVFENYVNKGLIKLMLRSRVVEIGETHIIVDSGGERVTLENDFVLALTGFRPDRKFLRSIGIELEGEAEKPRFNPETMETNVKGVYLAGVIAAGAEANEIFIETGRFHGELIAKHIASQAAAPEAD
jgi:thioredoxin reductase (NADPH)